MKNQTNNKLHLELNFQLETFGNKCWQAILSNN